jgi:hypothetical protein
LTILSLLLIQAALGIRTAASDSESVDFNRDIRPILSEMCLTCHGPDGSKRQADLRLDLQTAALANRDGRAPIVPGQVLQSEVYKRITSTDPDERMPPRDSGLRLTQEQIEVIRRWIEQGASWPAHWSFIAPQRPRLPDVKNGEWPRNEVDYFILSRLENEGLAPAPPADKRTLIRRLSLDLTGLPPSRQQIASFLADARPEAYEKLVDRLLASPAFGERMALDWLDAARYADTHGYHEDYHRDMWPWRDWVIDAFNANMPFDQFTIEQLAGDLLPNATNSQIVATGFNRNHGVTASGISEEYRVEYVLDRVRTTSTVWLGLSMQCAQCHSHKYDPISHREFYQFFAYFNSITDKGVENRSGNVDPLVKVESPKLDATLAILQRRIAELEREQERRAAASGPALIEWEKQLAADGAKKIKPPRGLLLHYPLDSTKDDQVANVVSERGSGEIVGAAVWMAGRVQGALSFDGQTYVDLRDAVAFERTDAFSYGAWVYPKGGGAVIARMDDASSYRGWDVFVTGDHVEAHIIGHWPDNAIYKKTKAQLKSGKWTHLFVTFDGSSKASGLQIYFNGKPQEVQATRDQLSGTIKTDKPLLIGRRNPSGFFTGLIDDVRVYSRALSAAEVATLAGENPIAPILAIPQKQRSEKQRLALRQYYLEQHDDQYKRLGAEVARLRVQQAATRERASQTTLMVMQEMKERRTTFVLKRGQYDQHGQAVAPGTPAFLPPLPAGAKPNRLTLARWIVSPKHPLTARVAVNRLWQLVFGTGIVKTSEDFGTQGELPSRPELLDWLSTEFVRTGWDVKRMMKTIVMSAAYRQSSRVSPELLARDPQNRLLARGPRFRLPAELIRDNALAAGGLLVDQLGGPSAKPYQPEGLWKEMSNRGYEQDHGAKLFRRSLYTYWKRSVPPPNMFAIDAPTRETCIVRRQRTNTPLMALVMLNDLTFVEAARGLAQRAMTEDAASSQDRIDLMFELATARRPAASEREVLLGIHQRQVKVFLADKDAALKLLSIGESKRNDRLDVVEHAALTAVANVILNLDETITKE